MEHARGALLDALDEQLPPGRRRKSDQSAGVIGSLKDVRNAPVLRIGSTAEGGIALRQSMPLANHLALTETKVEAVKDFADVRRMRARGLRNAEDGSVETMDGRRLSDPGVLEVLDKIVRGYED